MSAEIHSSHDMWIQQQGKVEEEILELWRREDWKWRQAEFDSKGSGGLSPLKPLISVWGVGGCGNEEGHAPFLDSTSENTFQVQ